MNHRLGKLYNEYKAECNCIGKEILPYPKWVKAPKRYKISESGRYSTVNDYEL